MKTRILLLRLIFSFVLLVPPGCSANSNLADQRAIEAVIRSQLKAFQADDNDTAYELASPAIKQYYPDVKQFVQMVKSGYQPVYRSQSVKFMEFIANHNPPIQHLIILGPSGHAWDAFYSMAKSAEGTWKIAGVRLIPRNESAI
jgi:hypothetical protein